MMIVSNQYVSKITYLHYCNSICIVYHSGMDTLKYTTASQRQMSTLVTIATDNDQSIEGSGLT